MIYGKASACPGIDQPLYATGKPPADDGGPAFPWGEHGTVLGGMTLRDYFAVHSGVTWTDAVTVATEGGKTVCTGPDIAQMLAHMRFQVADAMIKAREAC